MKLLALVSLLLVSGTAHAGTPSVYEQMVSDAFLMARTIGDQGTTRSGQSCSFSAETPDNGGSTGYLRLGLNEGSRGFFLYIMETLELTVAQINLPDGAFHRQYSYEGKVLFAVVYQPGEKRVFMEAADPAMECGVAR